MISVHTIELDEPVRAWHRAHAVTAFRSLLMLVCSLGCGDSPAGEDAAGLDAGRRDSGRPDAAVYEEPSGCIALPDNTATVALDLFRDDWTSRCKEGTRDAAFTWTAPARGRYVITCWGGPDTRREPLTFEPDALPQWFGLPPILLVLDGDCGDAELACEDANVLLEEGELTRAVVQLDADQTITLVLDAPASASPYSPEYHYGAKLAIEPAACGTIDLGDGTSAHVEGTLRGTAPPIGPVSCSPDPEGAPAEMSFRYVAPEAGRYVATLSEEYGEPVALAAFDPQCIDERACVASGEDQAAQLELQLEAREAVVLVASANSTGDADFPLSLDVARMDAP